MLRRLFTSPVLVVILFLLPVVYTGYHYTGLPATIPIHFNANGEADGFGKRSTIWLLVGLLTMVSVAIYLVMANIHKIDPKRAQPAHREIYRLFAGVMLLFMTIVQLIISTSIIYPAVSTRIPGLIFTVMGLLFATLGSLMREIPPNYFIGIRLPWTLKDPGNWLATHRLMSVVWLIGGGAMCIVSLLLPFITTFVVFICLVLCMIGIPSLYSYNYYKRH